jgi:hypothetical protein
MADAPSNGSGRLDSWKAIAAYLQRDERTVQRWERELGLPIRRVPGRGRSVFAYTNEIDEWLKTSHPGVMPLAGNVVSKPRREPRRVWIAGAAAGVAVAAVAVWYATSSRADAPPLRVEFTESGIVARDGDGDEQWRFPFAPGERAAHVYAHPESAVARVKAGTGFLAAIGAGVKIADDTGLGGELFWLSSKGTLLRRFAFDDRLTFGAGVYGAPWVFTDFREDDTSDSTRVALASHHYTWWPSIVTVLDETFQRRGTFVNAGWIERVHWLSPDRLLIAGFSNPVDGAVAAILDVNALDGQSPDTDDPQYHCATCGTGRPLRYIVMPRTEVNRASQSRFNRARLQILPDRILVRTVEMAVGEAEYADAVYEFSPALDLLSSSFSVRYWDMHEMLHKEGKLDHDREHCPDRDGPPEIRVWAPETGWQTIRLHGPR